MPSHFRTSRRQIITGLCALGASQGFSGAAKSQIGTRQNRIRIPVSAMGLAAIGRVRGRLQIAFDDMGLTFGSAIYLRLIKEQRRLEVWVQRQQRSFVRLRSYKICGSGAPLGPRSSGRVPAQPEGFYLIGSDKLRPSSITYLGLDIGWPNSYDRARGWAGTRSLLQAGCAAAPDFGLTDQDMEEVYTLVHSALSSGQSAVALHIFPFDMNGLRMLTEGRGPYRDFWRQLAPAWQAFERTKKPPQIQVLGRRYVVTES